MIDHAPEIDAKVEGLFPALKKGYQVRFLRTDGTLRGYIYEGNRLIGTVKEIPPQDATAEDLDAFMKDVADKSHVKAARAVDTSLAYYDIES